jgi:hypothetical protein
MQPTSKGSSLPREASSRLLPGMREMYHHYLYLEMGTNCCHESSNREPLPSTVAAEPVTVIPLQPERQNHCREYPGMPSRLPTYADVCIIMIHLNTRAMMALVVQWHKPTTTIHQTGFADRLPPTAARWATREGEEGDDDYGFTLPPSWRDSS